MISDTFHVPPNSPFHCTPSLFNPASHFSTSLVRARPALSLGVHSHRCSNYRTEAHPDARHPESATNDRGCLGRSSHVDYSIRDSNSQERSDKLGELNLLQPSHVAQDYRSDEEREALSPLVKSSRVISSLTSIPLAWQASIRSYVAYVLAGMRCFNRAFMSLERGLRLSQARSLP